MRYFAARRAGSASCSGVRNGIGTQPTTPAGGALLGGALKRPEEASVAGPAEGAGLAGVDDGMPCEAGLGIGLGSLGTAEKIGNRALAGAGAADDGQVQRRGRLTVKVGADT